MEKLLLAGAILIILLGTGSTIYVHSIEIQSNAIEIDGRTFTIDQIFSMAKQRTLHLQDGNFSGVALDDLIKKIGISNYENRKYTFVGADGYQKTVEWEDLKKGILLKSKRVVFYHLPKQYRVRDIVKIEVV